MSGSGTIIADGGLTIGGTAASTTYREYLSGSTLENFGAATLGGNYNNGGLYFDSGTSWTTSPAPASA